MPFRISQTASHNIPHADRCEMSVTCASQQPQTRAGDSTETRILLTAFRDCRGDDLEASNDRRKGRNCAKSVDGTWFAVVESSPRRLLVNWSGTFAADVAVRRPEFLGAPELKETSMVSASETQAS